MHINLNSIYSQYVSDFPPSQNVAQGHFMVKTTHKSRLMYSWYKKYLAQSAFYRGTSDAEQSTQLCKVGKAWKNGPLKPSVQKTINHPAQIPDGLCGGNRKSPLLIIIRKVVYDIYIYFFFYIYTFI